MRFVLLVAVLFSAACKTEFYGSAHIDPSACQLKCDDAHLEMQGMVYMGEYSSACICGVPRPASPPASAAAGAVTGAVAGVVMQMRYVAQQNDATNDDPSHLHRQQTRGF